MNVKEYLLINNTPLLNDSKNVFILEWLEANSFCTPFEISQSTNISLSEIHKILQVLYKNSLISLIDEKYKINLNGIKLLNKLGLSDLQINKMLEQTKFVTGEYNIYKSIFRTWRMNFTDFYLIILQIIKDYDSVYNLFWNSNSSIEDSYSIFIATLFNKFSNVLYTNETSELMNHYIDLYNFSSVNYCYSSEIYHTKICNWDSKSNNIIFSKNISDYLNHKLFNSLENKKQAENFNFLNLNYSNNINHDFELSYKISTNKILLDNILSSQNIKELKKRLNLTELQTRFILKSIRSKINNLLLSEDKIVPHNSM